MRDKNWLGRREAGRKAAAGEETVRGRKYGRLTHLPTDCHGRTECHPARRVGSHASWLPGSLAMAARLPL